MESTVMIFASLCCVAVKSFELTPEVPEKSNASSCESKGKTISDLDLALTLIQSAKDNYPTCTMPIPLDCEDILHQKQNKSGVYTIRPRSRVITGTVEVYCDMTTDGGGWTVIQRRGNFLRSKDYFFQDWKAYKEGFGNVEQDFWLGNDNIFALTTQKLSSVRFDLEDAEGNKRYAVYDTFWIADEDHKYALTIAGYKGDAGDSMIGGHNGQNFSTKDQDNDKAPSENCAEKYKGGWWYNKCHVSNLNGLYHRGKHESFADGVNWHAWKGYHDALAATEMKIRSKAFRNVNL